MPPLKGTKAHPNSLANLNRQGGQARYEEPKKQRNIQVTSIGWEGIRALASERGLSLNELIEQIGRGKIPLGEEQDTQQTSTFMNSTAEAGGL